MTASLPVPHEPASDDEVDLARPAPRGPRPLPAPPKDTAEDAAAAIAAVEPARKPAARPRKPRSTAAPRKRPVSSPVVADPGPPPPLPADLDGVVIPPVPPLPAVDPGAGLVVEEIVVPPKPPAPVLPDAEHIAPAEPAVDVQPDAAAPLDAVVDAEPAAEAAPFIEAEPVIGAEPVVEAEPVIEAADVEAEPVVEAAPVVEAEPVPEVESVVDAHELVEAEPAASVDIESAALSVQGVTKTFGDTRAVDGIDLVVPPGIFYGLVGPNGAGKTTTLSMIAGLLRPDRGTITVGGVDAAASPRAAKKLMGVLPDRLRTFDRLTGRQLLYYCGVLRGLAPAVVESRAADLARAFDLSDALGRPVSDYSAGMTKKVMLAGAMIHSPRLLVLDEPFESVDPVSSAAILDILGAYVAHGGTVILSSHGMDLVERVCSRVAVMVAGQVLAEGTIDEVRGELTLEQRFVELAGGLSDVEGLEWLHTFSG